MSDLGYGPQRDDPWTRPRAVATVLALPVVTVVILLLFYGGRFPWIRSSFLMTLVTCLAGVAGAGRQLRGRALQTGLMYAFVVVPLVFLLIYPSTSALDVSSDPSVLWVIGALAAVHGVGFSQVRRAVEDAEATDEGE